MKKILFFAVGFICLVNSAIVSAQIQFIHYPADTANWIRGNSESYALTSYNNDTFTITTARGGENNFIYNNMPVTLFGAASTFSASFDFRMDSSGSCSDGLTFWYFTSSLSGLGSPMHEGGDLGFPDTVSGFAMALQTTVCMDDIYMKKINSTSYNFGMGGGGDTNICTSLTHQMFLTDSAWHHCDIEYNHGNITTTFDGGAVTMSGYNAISGTGHFGFMGTNGGGYTRKCLKNIQINTSLGTPTDSTDSFGVYVNKMCNGPQLTVQTHSYSASYHVITYYGDGSSDNATLSSGLTGGYAVLSHNYGSPGTYLIKQVLYNGTTRIDSLNFSYENTFCATLPIKFYYDGNNDCVKDGTDPFITQPIVTEVDSNGIPVDTISATSGLYYATLGHPGDVYSFKIITPPGNMYTACPLSGIIKDTLQAGVFITPVKYFGLNCGSGSNFDLSVHAEVPVTGIHDQWGDIYVSNAYCAPTDATLTVKYSPKYIFTGDASPTPTSSTGNTLIWNLSGLSSQSSAPTHIHYQVDYPSTGPLTVGDTVHTTFIVTPTSGDMHIADNTEIIIDTVRAGCDPNEMEVLPDLCIPFGQAVQLQYTINFENTGNDTAFNIYVMDTLSDDVDPSSLRIVSASAVMNIAPYKNASSNIVRFDFPQIDLLDSTHHNQCNGTVVFTINTKEGLPVGSSILNHAGIFFDDNAVVMTNTVKDVIGCPGTLNVLTTQPAGTRIHPNPATDELTITTDNSAYNSYTITNNVGQVLMQQQWNSTQTTVDVKALAPGLYYITLKGNSGTTVQKFVKM